MRRARLLIFAKPPRMGLAKTRLAAGMGWTEARRIAHFTLARTMRAVRGSGLDAALYLAPDRALDETLGGIWPPDLPRFRQGPGTLTERLGKGLADSPNGPVLFIVRACRPCSTMCAGPGPMRWQMCARTCPLQPGWRCCKRYRM